MKNTSSPLTFVREEVIKGLRPPDDLVRRQPEGQRVRGSQSETRTNSWAVMHLSTQDATVCIIKGRMRLMHDLFSAHSGLALKACEVIVISRGRRGAGEQRLIFVHMLTFFMRS